MENDTYESMGKWHDELIKKYIPPSKDSFKTTLDKCNLKIFLQDESLLPELESSLSYDSAQNNFTLIKCNQWVYSKKYFESTLNSEVIL